MVLVFCIDRLSGFGGAQRVLTTIANHYSEKGNDVYILLTGNDKNSVYPLSERIEVVTLYENGVFHYLKSFNKMKRMVKSIKPDIIVSFLSRVNVYTLMAVSKTNIPIVISERNDPDTMPLLDKVLAKMYYRRADALIVQTNIIKEKMRHFYKGNTFIIKNPLFNLDVEKDNYESTKTIVAVGRLAKQKNYDFMIDCMSLFLNDEPNYVLKIYGKGKEKKRLEKRVLELGLVDNIIFEGNSNNVLQIEKDADFYVMTSLFEGMPNALAEAMGVGLPCISIDCEGGGASSLITDKVNGFLVKKGDTKSFVDCMKKMANDYNLRFSVGQNAKGIKKELSVGNILAQWDGVISKCVYNEPLKKKD